jgi:hypothetical protein
MKNYSQTQAQISSSQPTANGGIGDVTGGLMILTIPVLVLISMALYKRYRVVQYQRQRETLERIWKLDYREKTA